MLIKSLATRSGGNTESAIGGRLGTGRRTYADRHGLVDPALPSDRRRRLLMTTLVSSGVFALSIPLAFFNADLAKFFWFLMVPANVAGRWFVRAAG